MEASGRYGPPPPPTLSGSIPARRIPTQIPAEAPACVQNAMMTKDKKPFTYTPGGIDLSQIKSPRMAQRISRNALMEGVSNQPRPSLNIKGNEPQIKTTPPTPPASALGMPVQVFPTGPPAPPPPPPQNNIKKLAPQTGNKKSPSASPTPTNFEPPPIGFRPEIKIPPNPMANLKPAPRPQPKDDFWKEEYIKERSKSPKTAPSPQDGVNGMRSSSPVNTNQIENRSSENKDTTKTYVQNGTTGNSEIIDQDNKVLDSPTLVPLPRPLSPIRTQENTSNQQNVEKQKQQEIQKQEEMRLERMQKLRQEQIRQEQIRQEQARQEHARLEEERQEQMRKEQERQEELYRERMRQEKIKRQEAQEAQRLEQIKREEEIQKQHLQQQYSAKPHNQRWGIPANEEREMKSPTSSQNNALGSLYIPPVPPEDLAPHLKQQQNQNWNITSKNDEEQLMNQPTPTWMSPKEKQTAPSWAAKEDGSQAKREHIIPIMLEQTPTKTPTSPGFPQQQPVYVRNYNAQQPYQNSGYQSPNPNQFVNQYNNISFPPPIMAPIQRVTSPPILNQPPGTRVIPIQVQIEDGRYKGPVSQNPTVMQNDPRNPANWGNGGPNQSKSFRILQKITDSVDDMNINENGQGEMQQPVYARQHPYNRGRPQDQPQQYIHPSEQQVPEPKKYMGSAIPSRSFKILQAMTTPENAGPGQSDL